LYAQIPVRRIANFYAVAPPENYPGEVRHGTSGVIQVAIINYIIFVWLLEKNPLGVFLLGGKFQEVIKSCVFGVSPFMLAI